jgi:hypothetical protein
LGGKFFHAKFLAQSDQEATTVVSVQPISVAMTKFSEEKQPVLQRLLCVMKL